MPHVNAAQPLKTIIRRAVERHDVQPLFQQVNEGQKQLPIEAILVEVARGTVGCRHHCHPRIHEPRKKTRHDGGISHIVDHHFVERSEEHTSELQSLMRISYAVFCLKKKKTY